MAPALTIRWVVHHRLRQLLREARVSRFEEHSFLTGLLLVGAAVVLAVVNGDLGGSARALGALALVVLGLCAASRGLRLYRANVTAALPESVRRIMVAISAAIGLAPAFLLGWFSRLSVLGMSRSREFAADAAAAALTGRPSALASALMKLDGEREWLPAADLRQAQARAVLCIVGADSSRLGPLFRTHPSIAARVKRLQAIEQRVQENGRAVRLDD